MLLRALPLALVPLLSSLAPTSALWPAPQNYSSGSSYVYLAQTVAITYNGAPLAYTAGYSAGSTASSEIVRAGVSRALDSIFADRFVPWRLVPRHNLSSFEPDVSQGRTWLASLRIVQTGSDSGSTFKPLAGEADESYNLTLGAGGTAVLSAVSSVGVLRGLETFAQLFYMHSDGTNWYTPYAPLSVQDSPRYAHRGMLLDVARNFYPVSALKRTIDALAWNKMNTLHLHATDSQSWPLEIPSMPEVADKGAYAAFQKYSAADLRDVQWYGQQRGVQVVVEIDMPGHIGSLSWSHPELIVAYDAQPYYWWCAEPPCGALKLNDSAVDAFLGRLLDDLLPRVAPYSAYFHTGGDELNANDSMLDPAVRSNSTEVLTPLLQRFVDAQHGRVRAAGLTPMAWEEIPLQWNITLGNDTLIQAWQGSDKVQAVVAKGLKVIDSNYNFWYLDCGRGQWLTFDNGAAFESFYPFTDYCTPSKNWQLAYSYDPAAAAGLAAGSAEAALVVGGEAAVWSETIDAANLDALAWPRAGAVAEVLWSGRVDPATGANRSALDAAPRLSEMRERMVARGVGAGPVQMTWCTQAGDAKECAYNL